MVAGWQLRMTPSSTARPASGGAGAVTCCWPASYWPRLACSSSGVATARRTRPTGAAHRHRVGPPVQRPTVRTVGHRLLGVTAGWELFARGPADLIAVQLARGRITSTAVPQLATGNPIVSFLIGPHEAIVRSADLVPDYVIPDGGAARQLTGPLAGIGPLIPGPDPGHAWIMSGTAAQPSLSLLGLNGKPTGTFIRIPQGGDQLPTTAMPDGRGYVLMLGSANDLYDAGPTWARPVGGVVVATGPNPLADCRVLPALPQRGDRPGHWCQAAAGRTTTAWPVWLVQPGFPAARRRVARRLDRRGANSRQLRQHYGAPDQSDHRRRSRHRRSAERQPQQRINGLVTGRQLAVRRRQRRSTRRGERSQQARPEPRYYPPLRHAGGHPRCAGIAIAGVCRRCCWRVSSAARFSLSSISRAWHSTPPVPTPAPSPPPPVKVTDVGHPLLGVTADWQLFGLSADSVVAIRLNAGQITRTFLPQQEGSGPVSFIVGPRQAIVRPLDNVPGYLVPDGRPARQLTGMLASGSLLLPGPDPAQEWVVSGKRRRIAAGGSRWPGGRRAGHPATTLGPAISNG